MAFTAQCWAGLLRLYHMLLDLLASQSSWFLSSPLPPLLFPLSSSSSPLPPFLYLHSSSSSPLPPPPLLFLLSSSSSSPPPSSSSGVCNLQVDNLMYQLNSDSEGDEGSDINPELGEEEEEEDAQGSASGEDDDPQPASTAVHAEADQEAADEAGACLDAGPSHRASALADQITSTAEAGAALPHGTGTKAESQTAAEEVQSSVSAVATAIQDPIGTTGQSAELPDKQQGIKPGAGLAAPTECLPEQSLQADTLPYVIPESAAEQETLAYSPASGSIPLDAAELTLPSDAADGNPRASPAEQQTLCYGSHGGAREGEGEEAMFGKTGECSCLCKLQHTPINAAD